jgi:hypothetical protein
MRRNLPSVKTLELLTTRYTGGLNDPRSDQSARDRAKLIRAVLENSALKRCEKLEEVSGILNLHGHEYIDAGKGQKSPAIEYVNSGDTYKVTLLYVHGRGFKVGCWGDIIERGNYA